MLKWYSWGELNHRPPDPQEGISLAPIAVSIIEKAERRDGNERVFGKGAEGFGGWSKAKAALGRRILQARKLATQLAIKSLDNVRPMAPWNVHDVRRSVATHMADLGVLPHVIEAVLNHVSGHKAGVAGIYNRSGYEREVRVALALWADHVRWIVEGGEHKVVKLAERAAVAN
jgi:integrase